ncbi:MAG: phage baseplate assembly protein V, partial [Burkholderiales bacterium]|nr:phage baseplate assembly protein V [Burkholderiales bacterium]
CELKAMGVVSLESHWAVNEVPSATLTLTPLAGVTEKQLDDDLQLCCPGQSVILRLQQGGALFSGVVMKQLYRHGGEGSKLTLTLRHPLQRLLSSRGSAVFFDLSDEEVIRRLLRKYAIVLRQAKGLLSVCHPQLVQYECSDWQFMASRIKASNVWLLPAMDGGVSIVPPALAARAKHVLDHAATSSSVAGVHRPLIEDATWSFDNRDLVKSLRVACWDIKTQQVESRVFKAPELGSEALDARQLKVLVEANLAWSAPFDLLPDEARALAEARLQAGQAEAVRGSFILAGSTDYQPGDTLEIKGFGKALNGRCLISGVKHNMTPGEWRTTITVGLDRRDAMDAPLLPQAPGLQVGVVDAYEKDPQGLSRLRVKLPLLGEQALWARFATPYASEGSGLCLYPEPGDEVVLGFFAGDPRYPVILGAMHNPKRPPPIDPLQGAEKKGLIVNRKDDTYQMTLDCKANSMILQNGQSNYIAMSKDQGMTLQNGKDSYLTLDQKANVTLYSAKVATIEGKKEVNVKSNKVDLGS